MMHFKDFQVRVMFFSLILTMPSTADRSLACFQVRIIVKNGLGSASKRDVRKISLIKTIWK